MEDEDSFSQPKAKRLCKRGLCFSEMSWAWPGCTSGTRAAVSTCWEPGSRHSHCLFWAWKEASWKINPWQQVRPGELVQQWEEMQSGVGYPALRNCLLFSFTFPLLSSFPPTTFYFSFKASFFLVCSHWRTSGKGSQMEKKDLSVFSVPQFLHVCMYSL